MPSFFGISFIQKWKNDASMKENNSKYFNLLGDMIVFKSELVIGINNISSGIVLRWMPVNRIDDKLTLHLAMAWCR